MAWVIIITIMILLPIAMGLMLVHIGTRSGLDKMGAPKPFGIENANDGVCGTDNDSDCDADD
jgi:hypothetical protein